MFSTNFSEVTGWMKGKVAELAQLPKEDEDEEKDQGKNNTEEQDFDCKKWYELDYGGIVSSPWDKPPTAGPFASAPEQWRAFVLGLTKEESTFLCSLREMDQSELVAKIGTAMQQQEQQQEGEKGKVISLGEWPSTASLLPSANMQIHMATTCAQLNEVRSELVPRRVSDTKFWTRLMEHVCFYAHLLPVAMEAAAAEAAAEGKQQQEQGQGQGQGQEQEQGQAQEQGQGQEGEEVADVSAASAAPSACAATVDDVLNVFATVQGTADTTATATAAEDAGEEGKEKEEEEEEEATGEDSSTEDTAAATLAAGNNKLQPAALARSVQQTIDEVRLIGVHIEWLRKNTEAAREEIDTSRANARMLDTITRTLLSAHSPPSHHAAKQEKEEGTGAKEDDDDDGFDDLSPEVADSILESCKYHKTRLSSLIGELSGNSKLAGTTLGEEGELYEELLATLSKLRTSIERNLSAVERPQQQQQEEPKASAENSHHSTGGNGGGGADRNSESFVVVEGTQQQQRGGSNAVDVDDEDDDTTFSAKLPWEEEEDV